MSKFAKVDFKFIIYSIFMGIFVGFFTWLFLGLVSVGTHFIWHTLKDVFNLKYWTLIVASIGGILVGITQKYFGTYPKYIDQTLLEFKKNKRIDYKHLKEAIINPIIILLFGASVGPEAALSGIVGGLVTFVGDKMKVKFKKENILNENIDLFTEYSIQTSVGLIFEAPLFGLYALSGCIKDDKSTLKKIKTIVYTVSTLSGFLVFSFLSKIDNRESFIVKFGQSEITLREIIWFIPLIIIAMLLSYIYKLYGIILNKILKPIEDKTILKGIIGGVLIGIIGTLSPYALFSGEHELKEIVVRWREMSWYTLFLIALIKLLLTEICLSTGHRGGHIFPIVFSGSCTAYAVSSFFSVDPVFCLATIVTAITSKVIGNMYISIFLLIFFFPINVIIPMILAAIIGKLFNDFERKYLGK